MQNIQNMQNMYHFVNNTFGRNNYNKFGNYFGSVNRLRKNAEIKNWKCMF